MTNRRSFFQRIAILPFVAPIVKGAAIPEAPRAAAAIPQLGSAMGFDPPLAAGVLRDSLFPGMPDYGECHCEDYAEWPKHDEILCTRMHRKRTRQREAVETIGKLTGRPAHHLVSWNPGLQFSTDGLRPYRLFALAIRNAEADQLAHDDEAAILRFYQWDLLLGSDREQVKYELSVLLSGDGVKSRYPDRELDIDVLDRYGVPMAPDYE